MDNIFHSKDSWEAEQNILIKTLKINAKAILNNRKNKFK